MPTSSRTPRLATVWLGGCSGCHMSLLDLDEALMDLAARADIVYGPLVDAKVFPEEVDLTLVEGAVAILDHLELARNIRDCSRLVVSFGDCAVTGNVTSLRNRIPVDDLLTAVYRDACGGVDEAPWSSRPVLLKQALPLHQVIPVDAYLPGCPPAPDRIAFAIEALLAGRPVKLDADMRSFG